MVAVWTSGERALDAALGPGRVTLIDNGVDATRFTGSETAHEPPRVLYVGLLTPRKGVLDLRRGLPDAARGGGGCTS